MDDHWYKSHDLFPCPNPNHGTLCSLLQVQKPTIVKGLSQLPRRAAVRVQASSDALPVLAAAPEDKKFLGVSSFTWQKIIPLGLMFFW